MRIIALVRMASIVSIIFVPTTQADSAKSYMVGIRRTADGENYCAGALVAPRYVLTTSKCLPALAHAANPWPTWQAQVAVIGSKYRKGANDGETITVTRYFRHPGFDESTNKNDFVLLTLKHASTRTPVTMIPWPYNDDDPFKATADTIVTGWGTGPKADVTSELKTAHMMVLQNYECQDAIKVVDTSDMCLQGADKMATCHVDYGSMVIATVKNGSEFLGGVVNNVEACGKSGVPLKASEIQQGRNWIRSIIGR